jgi:hypothetical protein
MQKKFLLYPFFSLFFLHGNAQELSSQNNLYCKTYVIGKTVLFRFAPANVETWIATMEQGIKIKKLVAPKNATPDSLYFKQHEHESQVIYVMPISKKDTLWQRWTKQNPQAKMLYDFWTKVPDGDKTDKKMEFIFQFILFSADLDVSIAKAQGLYYADSLVGKNKRYLYEVSLNGSIKSPKLIAVDLPNKKETRYTFKIKGKAEKTRAHLSWNALQFSKEIAYYNIERSEDSILFKKVNSNPVVYTFTETPVTDTFTYSDTLPRPGKKYFFRIKGINPFGLETVCSSTICIMGKGEFNISPQLDSADLLWDGSIKLHWKVNARTALNELKGYLVSRAQQVGGNYSVIVKDLIKPSTNNFIDGKPQFANYYKIGAVSIYGDTVFSLPVYVQSIDSIPPEAPTGLTGNIDKNGLLSLRWKSNTEKDLKGYRVFRKNDLNEEFKDASAKLIGGTFFSQKVNLNTLTKKVYYNIIAVDKVFNKSAFSETLVIIRPDTIPPAPPIFRQIIQTGKGINIQWINSSSEDQEEYILFVYRPGTSIPQEIFKWLQRDSIQEYLFSDGLPDGAYRFEMRLTDRDGNTSAAKSHSILYKGLPTNHVINFKAEPATDKDRKSIRVSWGLKAGQNKKIFALEVYKNKGDENYYLLKTVGPEIFSLVDYEVSINNKYSYRLKIIFQDGSESPLSEKSGIIF